MRNSTFYCYNHQGKANAYESALLAHGFTRKAIQHASIVLMDVDVPSRAEHISRLNPDALKFVYPHSAMPNCYWDGIYSPWDGITAALVHASGHMQVLKAFGYPRPVEVIGWSYCPIRPFRPVQRPRKVLYAPIHPNSANWVTELDRQTNRWAYKELLQLVHAGKIELTVRYLRDFEANGLWPDKQVTFIKGEPRLCITQIDQADLVIGHETFAYLAIARGRPTLMMAPWIAPRDNSQANFRFIKSWPSYKDIMMYPLDICGEVDTWELIQRACASDEDIREWRSRMIGELFKPECFAETIRSFM